LKQTSYKEDFVLALNQRLPVTSFDNEVEVAIDNVYNEWTRKLCNARIQEFVMATKQEFAAKKGLAPTTDVNLRTKLLSTHRNLLTKVNK